jgi:aryl-alcohol dehydrogenase-like predicted oxidoreductase
LNPLSLRNEKFLPMQFRRLGKTGIQISLLSFGAGPISTLMVGEDHDRQLAVIDRALQVGINWFDTAATYGAGQSERSLGSALEELGAGSQVHLATKVRLMPDDLGDIRGAVRRSLEGSLQRLRVPRVTLLQLHNSITPERGDEPTSVTPRDVLGPGGIAEVMHELRSEGLVAHLGLTGIGHAASLREVVQSGQFETMQVPYHLLNPSAGCQMPEGFAEANYGNIIADCGKLQMGVLAIRVFAGGALIGNPPSPHTFKTPFFPLSLYERDARRAARLQSHLGPHGSLHKAAIRFSLAHPQVNSALIGFAEPGQIDEAVDALSPAGAAVIEWDELLANILE